jgi:hypothetical protein
MTYLCLFVCHRASVIIICVITIIAVILFIAACIIDGAAAAVYSNVQACAHPTGYDGNSSTYSYFGDSAYYELAQNCSASKSDFDCACVSSATNEDCLYLDGQPDCNLVSTKFVAMLRAATAFNVFTLLAVFALSVSSCCSLCCPGNGCWVSIMFLTDGRILTIGCFCRRILR